MSQESFEKTQLTLNTDKCQFSVNRVTFLGLNVDSSGVQPDYDKVVAIEQVPEPQIVRDVQRFLGMMNQMSKFLPKLANNTQPLKEFFLKGRHWTLDYQQQQAFNKVKRILSTAPVLAPYNPHADTILSADAMLWHWGCPIYSRDRRQEISSLLHTYPDHCHPLRPDMLRLKKRPLPSHGHARGYLII